MTFLHRGTEDGMLALLLFSSFPKTVGVPILRMKQNCSKVSMIKKG